MLDYIKIKHIKINTFLLKTTRSVRYYNRSIRVSKNIFLPMSENYQQVNLFKEHLIRMFKSRSKIKFGCP